MPRRDAKVMENEGRVAAGGDGSPSKGRVSRHDPSRIPPTSGTGEALRVLVLSADAGWQRKIRQVLRSKQMSGIAATTAGAARLAVRAGARSERDGDDRDYHGFDAAIIDGRFNPEDAAGLTAALRAVGTGVVLAMACAGVEEAVDAMRLGASDIVRLDASGDEIARRLAGAAAQTRASRDRELRIVKLERLCRRLSTSRRRVARQARSLCSDLVLAYQEMAEQMNQVTTATEYKGLIRNELDVESLLRTTLEFVLGRSGPTNAAVFLPTTSGDYSLGAYVNYDCPKETVDILLDHMANVIAPRFEDSPGLVHLSDKAGLDEVIGDDAQWLGDSHVIGFPCRHDGECLAIFMLFRDEHTPYTPVVVEQLRTIGELFAMQLARVIHIHHRHLPKEKWGMIGDPPPPEGGRDDIDDLAA